jgi:hypothetical protein
MPRQSPPARRAHAQIARAGTVINARLRNQINALRRQAREAELQAEHAYRMARKKAVRPVSVSRMNQLRLKGQKARQSQLAVSRRLNMNILRLKEAIKHHYTFTNHVNLARVIHAMRGSPAYVLPNGSNGPVIVLARSVYNRLVAKNQKKNAQIASARAGYRARRAALNAEERALLG